jgi:hypothetical protein
MGRIGLEHDPEKWGPVFPRDKRGTRLRGDHAQIKEIERDDVSKKYHRALAFWNEAHFSDVLRGGSGRVKKKRVDTRE